MILSAFDIHPLFPLTFQHKRAQRTCATRRGSRGRARAVNTSSYHLTEQEDGFTLTLQIPELIGRELTDLELNVEGNLLTLQVPELTFSMNSDLRPVWEEIPSASRRELFQIPTGVEVTRISATLEGDRLQVQLPKRAPVKHTIQINVAS